MAAENIDNTVGGTGLFNAKIPGLSDAADIQAALRLYHYGSYSYDGANTNTANLLTPSIAKHLQNLVDADATLTSSKVAKSGDTMTGPLILSGAPTQDLHSTTKLYVDTADSGLQTQITNLSSTLGLQTTLVSKGSSFTLESADAGKTILLATSSAMTLTVPLNSSVSIPIGSQYNLIELGIGRTTFSPSAGVTVNSKNAQMYIDTQYGKATLLKIGTNSWVVYGDIYEGSNAQTFYNITYNCGGGTNCPPNTTHTGSYTIPLTTPTPGAGMGGFFGYYVQSDVDCSFPTQYPNFSAGQTITCNGNLTITAVFADPPAPTPTPTPTPVTPTPTPVTPTPTPVTPTPTPVTPTAPPSFPTAPPSFPTAPPSFPTSGTTYDIYVTCNGSTDAYSGAYGTPPTGSGITNITGTTTISNLSSAEIVTLLGIPSECIPAPTPVTPVAETTWYISGCLNGSPVYGEGPTSGRALDNLLEVHPGATNITSASSSGYPSVNCVAPTPTPVATTWYIAGCVDGTRVTDTGATAGQASDNLQAAYPTVTNITAASSSGYPSTNCVAPTPTPVATTWYIAGCVGGTRVTDTGATAGQASDNLQAAYPTVTNITAASSSGYPSTNCVAPTPTPVTPTPTPTAPTCVPTWTSTTTYGAWGAWGPCVRVGGPDEYAQTRTRSFTTTQTATGCSPNPDPIVTTGTDSDTQDCTPTPTPTAPPFFPFFPPTFEPAPPFFPFFPPSFPTAPEPTAPPSFPTPVACVQGDVLVRTTTGYVKARDLFIGQNLVSYSFDELPDNSSVDFAETWVSDTLTQSSVVETTISAIKARDVETTVMFNGSKQRRFSLEHLMLVKRDGVYAFIQAGVIKLGDYLVYDINNQATDVLVEVLGYVDETTDVYDITVNPYSLFIAGDLISHNKKGAFQGLTSRDSQ